MDQQKDYSKIQAEHKLKKREFLGPAGGPRATEETKKRTAADKGGCQQEQGKRSQ